SVFPFLVCVTVIYIPLMLFGLLGNILTILVVWLRPHMRSSTYLYLSSMAVSDLLILLENENVLWRPRPWPLGDLACKLTMFLSECCTFCTILHITFLSLERYLAVCWPITAKTLVTRRRTRVLIVCLWLGAAVSAAPVLVMVGVEDTCNGYDECVSCGVTILKLLFYIWVLLINPISWALHVCPSKPGSTADKANNLDWRLKKVKWSTNDTLVLYLNFISMIQHFYNFIAFSKKNENWIFSSYYIYTRHHI
uniref:G-protein coupled receptors family 1 profile domain-containing protein n=1 Tax=Echeneis naucrates TaxID=173247 RepID=A0A665VIT3_ECHNA